MTFEKLDLALSTANIFDPAHNPSSPYALHPNENPVLVLVSPALTKSNYLSWSRVMRIALWSKNKLKFVDGTLKILAKDKSSPLLCFLMVLRLFLIELPKPSGSSSNNKYCTYCGKHRHTMKTYYKKYGYPPSYKSRPYSTVNSIITDSHHQFNKLALTQDQYDNLTAILSSTQIDPKQSQSSISAFAPGINTSIAITNLVSTFESLPGTHCALSSLCTSAEWIIDIGATDHITHSLYFFTHHISILPLPVTLLNGSKVIAKVAGTVQLSEDLILTDVVYLPEFAFNILFVTKLTIKATYCLVFQQYSCFIQELISWRIIGITKVRHGLYTFVSSALVHTIFLLRSKAEARNYLQSFFNLVET
ncbi:hypothetical protein MANES_09G070319v8 [Manihot esculenta]|uniref:Uncharacterized protein n=1 Tax=Manihot esculenta TaxID=3983 RepID=A0ACB7H3U8_MANES|nr:hypothetical protein MANES_09G070319v8 [Manihot esculenta]